MQKSILLDFDGVILTNSKISKLISKNSNIYLANKLNISFTEAKRLQSLNLNSVGHTSYIQSMKSKKSFKTCLEEYNNEVFSKCMVDTYLNAMTSEDVNKIQYLHNYCVNSNDMFVLFTNSNLYWPQRVLQFSNIDIDLMFDKLYTNDNLKIKPNISSYIDVEQDIHQNKIFIDDNIYNLLPVCDRTNWKIIHYSKSQNLCTLLKSI